MDKKMSIVFTLMTSFISFLLMILIGVVTYFGDKYISALERVDTRSYVNENNIDINEYRNKNKFNQIDRRFISVEDDVDSLEDDVKKLMK